MATKKTSRKKKITLDDPIPGDPPILVGGGGSTYLWVQLDQDERPVNPQSDDPNYGIKAGAPKPTTRANYTCSRVGRTPPRIYFYDGVNPETRLDIPLAGRGKWFIRFE